MDIKDLIIYRRTIPARKAIYSSFPESLNPKIVEFLRERGIDQLYCHQAQMYELAREGKNVVITTSSATGDTGDSGTSDGAGNLYLSDESTCGGSVPGIAAVAFFFRTGENQCRSI